NELGLSKTKSSNLTATNIYLYKKNILNLDLKLKADLVFSIGLIEHFEPIETAIAIKAHFDLLKPGSIAIISFPISTFLYKMTRKAIEAIGKWIFYDERPLTFDEVLATTSQYGKLLEKKINWKIFLTQGIVVVKKNHVENSLKIS
ncbi:MAG: class I SAM-dependent methyltransferase, partial [Acidobacteriota bacterium]